MDRTIHLSIKALAVAILFACGCQSSEDRLGIRYTTPEIPSELDRYFTPDPNQKAFELLREGETEIDMHEYYRSCHRTGWKSAVSELDRGVPRHFNSLDDVYAGWSAMQIGCEAFWVGYDKAYSQYEQMRTQ